MKKKLIKFTGTMTAFCAGAMMSSLWITHTDAWETYLPISISLIACNLILRD